MGNTPGNEGQFQPPPPGQQGGPMFQPSQGDAAGAPQVGQPPQADSGAPYGTPPAAYGAQGAIEPPGTVLTAVKLMYVGAGLSLLSMLLPFLMSDTYKEVIRQTSEEQNTNVDVDTIYSISLVTGVVMGVFAIALWVLNAVFNKKGAAWARILSTILGGLSVVFGLFGFTQSSPAITMIMNVVMIALAAAILFFLWRPESSRFYEAVSDRKLR